MDASEKWCPWARSFQDNGPGIVSIATTNRNVGGHGEPDNDCLCITVRCIAWRKYRAQQDCYTHDCARIRGPEGMVAE
jgi:hypothetical protein